MSTLLNPASDLLRMYNEVLSLMENKSIKPPEDYHEQVIAVKQSLKSDETGIVNTVLDYAIECASGVNYKVETKNENLNEIYNTWLKNINSSLRRKKIDVGVNGLAKQYFTEMLKGSSHALLRTIYADQPVSSDGGTMSLPELMWFVDGKDIYVKESESKTIGDEQYKLKIGKGKAKKNYLELPHEDNEEIFVQTPFDEWGTLYPMPFLIKRGIWKNMNVLQMISDEGEGIVRKALKYLLVILKGNKETHETQGLYEPEQLTKAKDQFKEFLGNLSTSSGVPALVANHDTQIDHLMPDFTKVVNQEIIDPSRQKILQGLGLIEILEGTGSNSRKDSIINPKPFVKLVYSLINSYCALLTNVLEVSREKNAGNTKYNAISIKVKASPVLEFISMDEKELFRTIFDRGPVDYESLCEILGLDYKLIVARSKSQMEDGIDSILYPHITMNQEQYLTGLETQRTGKQPKDKEVPEYHDDRNGSGRQDFTQAARIMERGIYGRNRPLPKSVKKLPSDLQKVWRDTWNAKFRKTGSEAEAFRLAFGVVNRIKRLKLKKSGGK